MDIYPRQERPLDLAKSLLDGWPTAKRRSVLKRLLKLIEAIKDRGFGFGTGVACGWDMRNACILIRDLVCFCGSWYCHIWIIEILTSRVLKLESVIRTCSSVRSTKQIHPLRDCRESRSIDVRARRTGKADK
jgi:hypothetical protein